MNKKEYFSSRARSADRGDAGNTTGLFKGNKKPALLYGGVSGEDAPEPPAAAHAGSAEPCEDRTLQPGLKPVLELLEQDPGRIDAVFLRKGRRGKETERILDLCREHGVRFSLVDDEALRRLWPGGHQGVIARLFPAGFTDLETAFELCAASPLPVLLALDQVQDPGNAGTLARTLYAFGGAGLIVPRHNGVYLGAAAAKASAGALERLAVVKAANLAQALDAAKKAGFTIYGASSAKRDAEKVREENAFTFSPSLPAILVLGSEEDGLRQGVAKRCDALLRIPMTRDFDSLNVAQAGAIILAAFASRQKGERHVP